MQFNQYDEQVLHIWLGTRSVDALTAEYSPEALIEMQIPEPSMDVQFLTHFCECGDHITL